MTSKVTYKGNLRTVSQHIKSGNEFITDAPTINAYTIPTLGEWGMIAFVGLMAFGGVFYVRRRIA